MGLFPQGEVRHLGKWVNVFYDWFPSSDSLPCFQSQRALQGKDCRANTFPHTGEHADWCGRRPNEPYYKIQVLCKVSAQSQQIKSHVWSKKKNW